MKKKNHCGFYIKQINTSLEKRANNDLRESGLTASQVIILGLLNDSISKEMTLKNIEKSLRLAQSTVVGTVSRLEEKKFIEYYDSLEDKRIKRVKITQRGVDFYSEAKKKMEEAEDGLLSAITETERVILLTILEKIYNGMENNSLE